MLDSGWFPVPDQPEYTEDKKINALYSFKIVLYTFFRWLKQWRLNRYGGKQ